MAGSIDNLNFQIILNDTDFTQRVSKNIQLAKDLNVQLSSLLDLQSKVRSINPGSRSDTRQAIEMQKLAAATAKAATEEEKLAAAQLKTQTAAERLAAAAAKRAQAENQSSSATQRSVAAQRSMAGAVNRTNAAYMKQSRLLRDLRTLSWQYLSIYGVGRMVSSLVRITGEFELQRTALGAIIGDLNQAEGILSQIKQLAVQSPFQFKELATYAKQLSAFSVPAEELFDTTKMLADVSAGLGVGMDRLVLAYGQVKSAAFLRGQEVRQFTEAGIPILAELAKQFTELEGRAVSTGEVFEKISARLVPFEMVSKMFKDMTSEGGEFYKMQEVLAETLRGKVSNLKDAFEIMMNEIGESKSGFLKDTVDLLRSMMENWEKIAVVLKTVIAVYGTYKAVLAAVWMYEKLMVAGRSIKYFVLLTKRVSTATAAMRAFGTTTKSAVAGIAGAVVGVIALIHSLVENANELNKELDRIESSEFNSADYLVSGLDNLVEKLHDAKKGSQAYRDIISEINRAYGDYLPQVYSEANAYEEVAAAAEKAKIAIMNKAKASALEKGRAEIDEESGLLDASKTLQKQLRNLLFGFTDLGVTEDDFNAFFKNLREALESGAIEGNIFDDFLKGAAEKYFNKDIINEATAAAMKISTDSYKESVENVTAALEDYHDAYSKYLYKRREFDTSVENTFSLATYSSKAEAERLKVIEEEHNTAVNNLKSQQLLIEDYSRELEKLEVDRLRKLVKLYGQEELNMPDKKKTYQAQLDALTKFAEGWKGIVQRLLKEDLKLTKNSSFGLWADETTLSTDYLDGLVKRYKELKEDIKNISSFDPTHAARLTKEKETIEAISKALNIDIEALAASKKGKGESPEEKRLKRLISTLRKLQTQYEKLKALGVEDFDIRNFFKNTHPELVSEEGADFVTNFNYIERALELIKELEKYDSEEAKKLRVEVGGDSFSIWVKQLEKQVKAYKEAGKAAEDYFKTLREWGTQDFNIDGSGIVFDINKIASDLTTAINKIDLKAHKLRETFNKILPENFKESIKDNIEGIIKIDEIVDLSSKFGASDKVVNSIRESLEKLENYDVSSIFDVLSKNFGSDTAEDIIVSAFPALKTVKENFVKEFGADSWRDFWKGFLREGYGAIDALAGKEKEYEKKKAQEKLNELAKKYVSEETSTLNMSDWGDKTIAQINEIQEALMELLSGDIALSDSTLASLKELGLTTDDLIAKIKELLAGKYNETTTEKIKKIQDVTKKALSIFGTMGASFEKIGEGFDNEGLSTAGEYLSVVGEITEAIADCDALWESVGASAKVAADAASEVGKAAGSLAASLSWITMIIKVVLIAVEQIANAFGRANAAQRQMMESTLHTYEVMKDFAADEYETIFGTNFFKKLIDSADNVSDAFKNMGDAWNDFVRRAAQDGDVKPVDDLIDLTNILEAQGKLSPDATFVEKVAALKAYKEELLAARKATEGFKADKELAADLEGIEEYFDAYMEAVDAFKENLGTLFGDIADDIASSMIEAFEETGDALSNLEKSFEDLGRSILQSLLSSFILDKILTKYEDRVADMMLKYAAGELSPDDYKGLVSDLKGDFDAYSEFFNGLMEAWSEVIGLGEDSAQNLADGIKGITEDTANLLASYLNAIRADVSYSKTLWERMDQSTQAIASALAGFSAPNLMEYQAQIAANTYNTALYTHEIMLGIRSVLTGDGGLSAIRVIGY